MNEREFSSDLSSKSTHSNRKIKLNVMVLYIIFDHNIQLSENFIFGGNERKIHSEFKKHSN